MNLQGATVLVTGGTGFIGGRLIEVLAGQYGARVRALIRGGSFGAGAFRIACYDIDFVQGDLNDPTSFDEAVNGCDYVFHCAVGGDGNVKAQRRVTVGGTTALARAAAAAGVKHFVNLSTIVTFGAETPAHVDEQYVPSKMWKWPYAIDKLDAEKALAAVAAEGGMRATTLRLGAVYGPYGPAFTIGPLEALSAGRVVLVNDGAGVCNATYVDDVVQAIILTVGRAGPQIDSFIIRGPDRVTWRDLYERYLAMLGKGELVSMTPNGIRRERNRNFVKVFREVAAATLSALKESPRFRRAAGAMPFVRTLHSMLKRASGPGAPARTETVSIEQRPLILIPEMMVDYYACTTDYSIDHARQELGYAPSYDLAAGMRLTEQWARWARLVPGDPKAPIEQ